MLMTVPSAEMLGEAIEMLTNIVAAIGAHRHTGKYDPEQLLDTVLHGSAVYTH
jgi:hypothetical protein